MANFSTHVVVAASHTGVECLWSKQARVGFPQTGFLGSTARTYRGSAQCRCQADLSIASLCPGGRADSLVCWRVWSLIDVDISIEVVASACLGHNGLIPDEAVVALPRWLINGFLRGMAPKER